MANIRCDHGIPTSNRDEVLHTPNGGTDVGSGPIRKIGSATN